MPHAADITGYHRLAVRLNRFPQGAPPSRLLYDILCTLFSEPEARLVSMLPIRIFTAQRAAKIWKKDLEQTRRILNQLCRKALLVDIPQNGKMTYCLPPPMAGFFEFSLMHKRDDIDQKALAKLFYQYINMERDFAQDLFAGGHTQLGRVYADESQIPDRYQLQVLNDDRTSQIIHTAHAIGISQCYCREKMAAVHRACKAPRNICMTLNTAAASLIRHGHARKVGAIEALEIIDEANSHHLVQFGENVRSGVNFICNCCKCCCEGMIAARRFAMHHPVSTSNFIAALDPDSCSNCGLCSQVCPVQAITVASRRSRQSIKLDADLCLGCGVCARACPTASITLQPRAQRVVTPLNTAHRVVLMAIERDKLQNIIFDNQVLFSHRALATLLSVIFRLPPVKRALAGKQLQSRYLTTLIDRLHWQPDEG